MKTILIQQDAQANVANGSNQDVISLDLSSYSTNRVMSIEVFFTMRYQDDGSVMYWRTAETDSTSSTRAPNMIGLVDSSYSFSQSITSTVHTPTLIYEQSNSTIYIRANNNTGSTQTVTYQVSYILNFI
jgi:hypothetical protein